MLDTGYSRDRNTIVDWDKLQRVLEDVVAGHPGYPRVDDPVNMPHYNDSEER